MACSGDKNPKDITEMPKKNDINDDELNLEELEEVSGGSLSNAGRTRTRDISDDTRKKI